MNRQSALPPIINAESVSEWLSCINFLDTIPGSNELLSALKSLSKLRGSEHDLLAGLDVIAQSVTQQTDKLITLLAQTSPNPASLNSKSRKIARLNALLIRALCLAYIHALGLNPPAPTRLETLAKILQLAGESIKANSLYYERGSTTLWKKMGSLYRLAHRDNVLNLTITVESAGPKQEKSIASLFKKNLILDLFNIHQTPYNKRTVLFDIAESCADKLDYSDQTEPQHTFYWDTQTEFPIQCGHPEKIRPNLVFISTERLIHHLTSAHPELTHEGAWFFGVWQKLNGYSGIIESLAPGPPKYYELALGLNNCLEQTGRFNRLANIERLSAQSEQLNKVADYELLPLNGMQIGHIDLLPAHQLDNTSTSKTERANIQPTRFENYCSAQIRHASTIVNTPVLIISPKKPPEFGVVRAKQVNPEQAIGWALIEKSSASLQTITVNYTTTLIKGLLLKKPNGNMSLILPAARYSCGDKLEIHGDQSRTLTLDRLEETNDQFICFQVVAD